MFFHLSNCQTMRPQLTIWRESLRTKSSELLWPQPWPKLPPSQRLALILYDEEECSYSETAAELGLSVKAVGSLLVRAKRRLRRELTGLGKKTFN